MENKESQLLTRNSCLIANPFACEQDSQTTGLPIIHPGTLRDSFLRKRTENNLIEIKSFLAEGCFLPSFSWSRKRMATSHTGEMIQKGRCKLAYERAV